MSDVLISQRLDKLQKIKEAGFNPYPQPDLVNKVSCLTASKSLGKKVTVAGRLLLLRGHGKILFADLHDRSGKIQLFFQESILKANMQNTRLLDIGDIVSASGEVIKTQAGEITINVSEFELLTKNLRPLPEKWHGLTDVEERYRQRYLDLIVNPEIRQVFYTRSLILTEIRHFLDSEGFLEVETPVLQPLYGGASARPFITHHETLNQSMYLRISDELYLKRLIVGGFEKVYEISRDFRNEGVSRFHNPEFTQVEFYWAYVDYQTLMTFTEKLLQTVIKKTKKSLKFSFQNQSLDFTPPFKRLTFRDAVLEKTAIDIDKVKTETDFLQIIKSKNLKLDLKGVVGLGAYFDALYKEYVRPYLVGPVFLTDYPACMIALAKRKSNQPDKIASFQLLACGTELLKAYNELNDPQEQYSRWLEEEKLASKGALNAMQIDHDYIRALEYGLPPTAGWGMGIDRLTQFLTDQPTIKDVILFPTMRSLTKTNSSNASGLENDLVVVGQVLSVAVHPTAKNLKIFSVSTGQQNYRVVSSCQNVKKDSFVPLALPGAVLFTPEGKTTKLKTSTIQGTKSEAMMCSPLELGLSPIHDRIHLLSDNLKNSLGQPLSLHLQP